MSSAGHIQHTQHGSLGGRSDVVCVVCMMSRSTQLPVVTLDSAQVELQFQ